MPADMHIAPDLKSKILPKGKFKPHAHALALLKPKRAPLNCRREFCRPSEAESRAVRPQPPPIPAACPGSEITPETVVFPRRELVRVVCSPDRFVTNRPSALTGSSNPRGFRRKC